jgi:hypothetical protein
LPLEKKSDRGARVLDDVSTVIDDRKRRLDNPRVELQNDPTTRAYIIAYGGRMSPVGQVEKLMSLSRDYMTTQRGIGCFRIVVVLWWIP